MLKLTIIRYKESYRFKADESKPDSFSNNWKNNSLDDFILTADGAEVFKCKCQSVANYCFGDMKEGDAVSFGDSVAVVSLSGKSLGPPTLFHREIQPSTKTDDIGRQEIDF